MTSMATSFGGPKPSAHPPPVALDTLKRYRIGLKPISPMSSCVPAVSPKEIPQLDAFLLSKNGDERSDRRDNQN